MSTEPRKPTVTELQDFRRNEIVSNLKEDHQRVADVALAFAEYIGRSDEWAEMRPYLHTLAEVALSMANDAQELERLRVGGGAA